MWDARPALIPVASRWAARRGYPPNWVAVSLENRI
jgi:hypothetical protein